MKYAILLLVLFSNVYAGTIDPKANDQEHLEYGSKYQCVVTISGRTNNDLAYKGSAVLISKHWAITAAHVIVDTKTILIENKKVSIAAYPASYDEKIFGKGDIALCYIPEGIELNFYPKLYDHKDEVGKVCGLAGYGFNGTFKTGAIKYDGKKRAGSNIIDEIDSELLVCSVHSGKNTSLEFLIAGGDSGGGLFIDGQLAGIHSCVWGIDGKLDSDYGDYSGHTRISVYKLWIIDTISKIEQATK